MEKSLNRAELVGMLGLKPILNSKTRRSSRSHFYENNLPKIGGRTLLGPILAYLGRQRADLIALVAHEKDQRSPILNYRGIHPGFLDGLCCIALLELISIRWS